MDFGWVAADTKSAVVCLAGVVGAWFAFALASPVAFGGGRGGAFACAATFSLGGLVVRFVACVQFFGVFVQWAQLLGRRWVLVP
jgi:hypothetical protein